MCGGSHADFQEIGSSGGKIEFTFFTDEEGRLAYSVRVSSSSDLLGPEGTPHAIKGVYALANGLPVSPIKMGGIGQSWSPRPTADSLPVLISSDRQGLFGHSCPNCSNYWRSEVANLCPYCRFSDPSGLFLSMAQRKYVSAYCRKLSDAFSAADSGVVSIDLDAVALAAGTDNTPEFFYADESQQHSFTCSKCGSLNDVLGRYRYCACCGMRNDFQCLTSDIEAIRERARNGLPYEILVREIVSVFDVYCRKLTNELLKLPMTNARRGMMSGWSFHDLGRAHASLKEVFGIDILRRLQQREVSECTKMFHRRHVYEHLGGEADQVYIDSTGDEVRLGQLLREDQASIQNFCTYVLKLSKEFDLRFHEVFPPVEQQ